MLLFIKVDYGEDEKELKVHVDKYPLEKEFFSLYKVEGGDFNVKQRLAPDMSLLVEVGLNQVWTHTNL